MGHLTGKDCQFVMTSIAMIEQSEEIMHLKIVDITKEGDNEYFLTVKNGKKYICYNIKVFDKALIIIKEEDNRTISYNIAKATDKENKDFLVFFGTDLKSKEFNRVYLLCEIEKTKGKVFEKGFPKIIAASSLENARLDDIMLKKIRRNH